MQAEALAIRGQLALDQGDQARGRESTEEGDRTEAAAAAYQDALRLFRQIKGQDAPLPDAFVTTAELSPHEHLIMQSALQKHVDSSISKTVNVPENISFEAFRNVYAEAWDLGANEEATRRFMELLADPDNFPRQVDPSPPLESV